MAWNVWKQLLVEQSQHKLCFLSRYADPFCQLSWLFCSSAELLKPLPLFFIKRQCLLRLPVVCSYGKLCQARASFLWSLAKRGADPYRVFLGRYGEQITALNIRNYFFVQVVVCVNTGYM